MKLSIALCTYNGEKYLAEQLQSFATQTLLPHELVICDDGSTDSSIEIIEAFKQEVSFEVKVYKNQYSLGAVKNFEKAIDCCSGDTIFLSDQDDIWVNSKLEKMYHFFQTQPKFDALFTDGELINNKSELIGERLWDVFNFSFKVQRSWSNGGAFPDLLHDGSRNRVTGATLAIKRCLYEKAKPFLVNGMWHDQWLAIHAAANNSLGWIAEPLIYYRIHDQQQVGIGQIKNIRNKVEDGKVNLEGVLMYTKRQLEDIQLLGEFVLSKYGNLNKRFFLKEVIEGLNYINYRTSLPRNIVRRILKVSYNFSIYKKHTPLPLQSMLRDIIRPAKV